jgi:hypothetical protein
MDSPTTRDKYCSAFLHFHLFSCAALYQRHECLRHGECGEFLLRQGAEIVSQRPTGSVAWQFTFAQSIVSCWASASGSQGLAIKPARACRRCSFRATVLRLEFLSSRSQAASDSLTPYFLTVHSSSV